MKKNRAMRAASALLVAVLMTTCTISGTFAKYVTEGSGTATARVAAWGFGDATTITYDLFSKVYDSGAVSGAEKVIAPGTSQNTVVYLDYADSTDKGAPEVAYKVELNVLNTTSIADGIKNNENISWSFNGTTYTTDGSGKAWDKMVAAIEAYEQSVVAANTLPTIATSGIAIGWSWDFYTDTAHDVADTALGDADPLGTVQLDIQFVATQLDTIPTP